MTQAKFKAIALRVVVTFVEAAAAYWAVGGHQLNKVSIAGAVGAGISAVYNLVKHYLTVGAA